MSHDLSDRTVDSTRVEKALVVASEFRAVLRYAIDAMPLPVAPLTSDDVFRNLLQRITASLHGAFEAALLLCSKGWGIEADTLLRQMMEAVVNARVVKRSPSALYLYIAAIESEMLPRVGKDGDLDCSALSLPTHILGSPALEDGIARFQKGKHKGDLRKWKNLSMPERIRLAELKEDNWYGIYGWLCEGIHVSALSLPRYMKGAPSSETESLAIWFAPNWQEAFRAVGAACALLLVHIGTISSTFSIGLHEEIIELGKRLETLRDLDDSDSRKTGHANPIH